MKRFLPFFFCLATLGVLNAQAPTVIFSETFNGSLGTFKTGAGSPKGATWKWSARGKADTVLIGTKKTPAAFFGNLPAVSSPTAANGAAQFNSDAYDNGGNPRGFGQGPYPTPHTDTLTSPSINCSNYSNVTLVFYQFIRTLNDDYSIVQVSGDGGQTWKDYPINQKELSNEVNALKPELPAAPAEFQVVIDISEVAARKNNVRVRFIWNEADYYFWIIDDVSLIESPDNNLAISDYFYPAASLATPASQIAVDTFGFSAEVSNYGKKDATNVVVRASVIDRTGKELFADSLILNTLPAGYRDSTVSLTKQFPPELQEGVYGVVYEVYAKGVTNEFYPLDNSDGDLFFVTDNVFSKDIGFLVEDAEWPAGFRINGNYQMGNYYRMNPKWGNNKFVASSASFSVFRSPSDGPITGNVINVLLYKIKDRVDLGFTNFNERSSGSSDPTDDLELVGFGTHTFTEDHDAFEPISVALEDFDGNPVALAAGGRYFLVADYRDNNNKIIHLISDDLEVNTINTVIFSDNRWFLGGFGPTNQAIMRLEIMMTTDRDEVPLADGALKLFPNPASSQLQVQLNLEENDDAMVIIADITGKIIRMQEYQNVRQETLSFDVSQLAAGTYLLRVGTNKGTKTMKFVVGR